MVTFRRLLQACAAPFLALAITLMLCSAILLLSAHNPLTAWEELFRRALLRDTGREEILVRCAPLLLAGSAVLLAVRAGVWNIGIDGQVLVGALTAGVIGTQIGDGSRYVLWIAAIVGGGIAGALWAAIPAVLRARWGINDVVTSIMFTYVATSLTAWLVKGPFKDDKLVAPQTTVIPIDHRLTTFGETRIHLGVVIAVMIVLVLGGFLARTVVGYKLRVVGESPAAASFARISVGWYLLGAFVVSGALAGLAGVNDVLSTKGTFQAEWNPQYGLTAFALVYLARRNAWGLLPAALVMALLSYGADVMPRAADIPPQFFSLFEGILLITLVCLYHLPGKLGRLPKLASSPGDDVRSFDESGRA